MLIPVILFLLQPLQTKTAATLLPGKGLPPMQHYTPEHFNHAGKVWDIERAPNGIMYMAADGGLLEYDGRTWQVMKGSAGTIRSLLVENDSTLVTGSDRDFGIWKRNALRKFQYTSLYPFRETLLDLNEEFWGVYRQQDQRIFISAYNIYVETGGTLTKIQALSRFRGSAALNEVVYLLDEKNGLVRYENLTLTRVHEVQNAASDELAGIYTEGGALISVYRSGKRLRFQNGLVQTVEDGLSKTLSGAGVFRFERLSADKLAYGTIRNGLLLTGIQGTELQQIDKHFGLPNNTILSFFSDASTQLWLGMDFGISCIKLNHPVSFFADDKGDIGSGYTAALKNGRFYLGTNQGLYQAAWSELGNRLETRQFDLIAGTEGQVWSLAQINGTMLAGHDRGLFEIGEKEVSRVGNLQGVWTFVPYRQGVLAGTYNGISVIAFDGKRWSVVKTLEKIRGSCSQLIVRHNDELWVHIPNFGLIKTRLDENWNPDSVSVYSQTLFTGANGHLSADRSRILFVTGTATYAYDAENDRFVQTVFDRINPELPGRLPGIFPDAPLDHNTTFIPVYNGFALRRGVNQPDSSLHLTVPLLRTMEVFNNRQKTALATGAEARYALNNLRLTALVPNRSGVLYQSKLNREAWSDWSPEPDFVWINLQPGSHTFQIRAGLDSFASSPLTVTITVNRPWYASIAAFFVYLAILALIFWLIERWKRRSLRRHETLLLEQQQKVLEEQDAAHRHHLAEIEQAALQDAVIQLKEQLKQKTIELAGKAKENEKKNQLLISLKEKLNQLKRKPATLTATVDELNASIETFISHKDATFELQLNELHQDFFNILKKQFNGLSAQDLRLCAYIKLGLNAKETADLLNILPSSVYISRSRLRKKLNLESDNDLHSFLNSF